VPYRVLRRTSAGADLGFAGLPQDPPLDVVNLSGGWVPSGASSSDDLEHPEEANYGIESVFAVWVFAETIANLHKQVCGPLDLCFLRPREKSRSLARSSGLIALAGSLSGSRKCQVDAQVRVGIGRVGLAENDRSRTQELFE
jgi:hypothetical protein